MSIQIDARVKQKTDTLTNWLANPLILLSGEQAFVKSDLDNTAIAFKIGDGTKTFSELPFPDFSVRGKADTSTVWDSGTPSGLYIPTEDGIYDTETVDLTDGYQILFWDLTILIKVIFPIDLSGFVPMGADLTFRDGPIRIDRVNNKIIIPRFYYARKGYSVVSKTATDYGSSTAFTFDVQTSASLLNSIIFDPLRLEADPSENPFYVETGGTLNTLNNRCIIVSQTTNSQVTSRFNIYDELFFKEWNKIGVLIGTITVGDYITNFNGTSFQMEVSIITAGRLYVSVGSKFYAIVAANTDIVTTGTGTSKAAGINYVVYKISDSKLYVYNNTKQTEAQNNDFIFIGSFYNKVPNTISFTFDNFTIDGVSKVYYPNAALLPFWGTPVPFLAHPLSANYSVNFNTSTRQLETVTTSNFLLIGKGLDWKQVVAANTDLITTGVGAAGYAGINYVMYKLSDKKLYVVNASLMATLQTLDYVYVGAFYWSTSATLTIKTAQVGLDNFTINGLYKTYRTDPIASAATGEIIVPPKFWMLDGQTLPIYKNSMLRNVAEMDNDLIIANFSTGITDFGYPIFRNIGNGLILDPAELKSTIRIYSKSKTVTGSDYGVNITVNKVAANAKTGLSKNWFCWGDSLTHRDIVKYTLDYLAAISSGLTLTPFGTISSTVNTTLKCEGREGWTFLNFIGSDNTHLGDETVITRLADGATTSTLYQNPFLKLADATDKANHPTWCFRNTGVNAELSYTSDPVKTGNFYIFDAAYYVTQHVVGAAVPDVITIALSTNDITENGTTGVTNSLFAIEVMLTQIKAAYPSVKVGVIPATGQGTNSGNWSFICDWINQLNLKLNTLALSGVEIIGAWAHMNKDFIFPYSANANLRSDGNLTQIYTKTEYIHFGRDGYLPYAKAIGAYIINNI